MSWFRSKRVDNLDLDVTDLYVEVTELKAKLNQLRTQFERIELIGSKDHEASDPAIDIIRSRGGSVGTSKERRWPSPAGTKVILEATEITDMTHKRVRINNRESTWNDWEGVVASSPITEGDVYKVLLDGTTNPLPFNRAEFVNLPDVRA